MRPAKTAEAQKFNAAAIATETRSDFLIHFLPKVTVRSNVTITTEYRLLFQTCDDQVFLRKGSGTGGNSAFVSRSMRASHYKLGENYGKSATAGGSRTRG